MLPKKIHMYISLYIIKKSRRSRHIQESREGGEGRVNRGLARVGGGGIATVAKATIAIESTAIATVAITTVAIMTVLIAIVAIKTVPYQQLP